MNNYLFFKDGRFHSRASVIYDLQESDLIDNSLLIAKDDRDGAAVYMGADGEVHERQPCIATLSGTTLSNITLPARIMVEGDWHEVTDSVVALSFDYPGSYTVVADPVSELPKTFTVVQP